MKNQENLQINREPYLHCKTTRVSRDATPQTETRQRHGGYRPDDHAKNLTERTQRALHTSCKLRAPPHLRGGRSRLTPRYRGGERE
jgi:hypothetical protein